jgi:hypothetical protein
MWATCRSVNPCNYKLILITCPDSKYDSEFWSFQNWHTYRGSKLDLPFLNYVFRPSSTFSPNQHKIIWCATVLQIRIWDPVLFNPLDPGSGMNFFRIPDPKSFWLRLRLCSCKNNKQEKSKFALHFSSTGRIRDGKMFGSGMRKWLDPGKKHPGSATLVPWIQNKNWMVPVWAGRLLVFRLHNGLQLMVFVTVYT